jgi:hypothetical protein
VILDAAWGHAEETLRQDLPRTIAQLKAMNIPKIVLMGPPPGWLGAGLPVNVLDYYRATHSVLPARTFYRSNNDWTRDRDAMLAAFSRELGIQYISVRNVFLQRWRLPGANPPEWFRIDRDRSRPSDRGRRRLPRGPDT